MSFNPDPTKPAEEILFSMKRNSPHHPPLFFNGIEVKGVFEHKHLGLIFDPKLSFNAHITQISATACRGVGLIKHLRPYLPVNSLDQIYKMHVSYLHHILNLNEDSVLLKFLKTQQRSSVKGDWFLQAISAIKLLDIALSLEEL